MALSTCPKCSSHSFELKETEVSHSKHKLYFVQCSLCGCVISTQEFFNISTLIYKLAKKLNVNLDT